MILTDSELASLKAALNWWEWFGYLSTAVVGLGCVGEFIAEFTSVSKCERRKHKLSRLSLMVLIIGIAGELLSAARTSQLSGQIIASIEERAASADQKASEADDRASRNEKEAAQLRKDAETERLARVKIEARVAWRRLTQQQKGEIGNSLKRFSNHGISFWSNAGDVEASWFAADIAEAATKAGTLRVYAPAQFISAMEGGHANLGKPIRHADTGVIVGYTPDSPSQLLADAIVKELITRGFDAVTRKNESKQPIAPQVAVQVEARPEGPQGEYKLQAERDAKAKNKAKTSR